MKLGLERGVLEDLGPRDAGFVRRLALALVRPVTCLKEDERRQASRGASFSGTRKVTVK